MPAVIAELRDAVEDLHGGRAFFVACQRVKLLPDFNGMVAVFRLEGHESADGAFAWPFESSDEGVCWVAALRSGAIQTAEDAVRASIEAR